LGTKKDIKLFTLICVLSVTCILIYSRYRLPQEVSKAPLESYFLQLQGYELVRQIPFSDDYIKMLKLDDYIFVDYKGLNGNVNLYIGYYYTADKAYAAHSPLICYPSQGWQIENQPRKESLRIDSHTINYEEIVTSLDDEKELVLYWYQAGLQTNTQVYMNKIDMGVNKLMNKGSQNGFVRVAVPIQSSYEKAKKEAIKFTEVFYPQLLKYMDIVSVND
jgi:EpsI family protein